MRLVVIAIALTCFALGFATARHATGANLTVTATVLPEPIRIPGGTLIEGELATCRVEIVNNIIEVTC